jgi:hypothetical protein
LAANDATVWQIRGTGDDTTIAVPQTYGVTPPGAGTDVAPATLQRGVSYAVFLTWVRPGPAPPFPSVGDTLFTP